MGSLSANAGGPVLKVRQPPPHTAPPTPRAEKWQRWSCWSYSAPGGCPIGNGANTEASRGPKCKDGLQGWGLHLTYSGASSNEVSFHVSLHRLSLIWHTTKKLLDKFTSHRRWATEMRVWRQDMVDRGGINCLSSPGFEISQQHHLIFTLTKSKDFKESPPESRIWSFFSRACWPLGNSHSLFGIQNNYVQMASILRHTSNSTNG